jgi:cytochrome c oxidase subunit II
MKSFLPARLFALTVIAVALSLVAGPFTSPVHATAPRVVEITAKRFAFSPDTITLHKGETVILRLKSEDVTHGFFIRALKLDEDIPPDTTSDFTVTPTAAGTFTSICDHFCGANHGNMKMTIVVE